MDAELSNSIRPGNAQKDFQGQSAWKCFSYKGISRVDAELQIGGKMYEDRYWIG